MGSQYNDAERLGLGLFQMVMQDNAVLIYAGRTAHAAARYMAIEGRRLVFRFGGDVLHAPEDDADGYCCAATPAQIRIWQNAFDAAVRRGTADRSDPVRFAIRL